MGLPGRENSFTISLAIWLQFTSVTDGRTDTGRQLVPRLRIASRTQQNSAPAHQVRKTRTAAQTDAKLHSVGYVVSEQLRPQPS